MRGRRVWTMAGAAACALASPAAVAAPPDFDRPLIYSVNPVGNGDFIGAPHHGSDFVSYIELLWQKVAEAGSRSARVLASWREIERVKDRWDFSNLDRELALCDRYGLEPVVLICNIPGWVSPTGENTHEYGPKEENLPDFDRFITRLAKRYKGRVRYWEFWNEQNGFGWHVDQVEGKPRYNRTDEYIPLLYRAYKGIKAVDPQAQVAMGGLDDVMGNGYIFVEMSYRMRRERYNNERFWDAIATHPYNEHETDVISTLRRKLDSIRRIAAANGEPDLPIWITEYGWAGSRAVQAWGTWGFLEFFARPGQSDVLIAQQLCIADFEPVHQGYALCNLNLRPWPAYHEFQRLARPDVPQVRDFRYRLPERGTARISGELTWWPLPAGMKAFIQIVDEGGEIRGRQDIDSQRFAVNVTGLPADEPMVAELRYAADGGKPQHPIDRLPLLLPSQGPLASGGFEGLFRAGVPWGWSVTGEAIVRDAGPIGDDWRHDGEHSLLVVTFDNRPDYLFNDRIEIPVFAGRGETFEASCAVRLITDEPQDGGIRISLRLLDPAEPYVKPAEGRSPTREWSDVKTRLTAPCEAPILSIGVHSDMLPVSNRRQRWLVILDDVRLQTER